MAPPSRTVPHPGRALVLLLVLIVAMLLGILGGKLFTPSQWDQRFKVGLGLDLSSGTQVTLQAQTQNGKAPSKDEMNAAISVIQSRVNGTGNSGVRRLGCPERRDLALRECLSSQPACRGVRGGLRRLVRAWTSASLFQGGREVSALKVSAPAHLMRPEAGSA